MSPADFCFVVAHVYLARSVTPLTALCMAVFWFLFALFR